MVFFVFNLIVIKKFNKVITKIYYLTDMKTIINLNFQVKSEGSRPDDASLNTESIVIESLGNIPNIGDYVRFKDEGENNSLYVVKTRLFEYHKLESNKGYYWTINASVVVERRPQELYKTLIHM
jgi:hypothetical protein